MSNRIVGESLLEIQVLFNKAHEGSISPTDFYKALSQFDITNLQKMRYMREAFDLSLEKAKEIVIQVKHGSVETWAEEIGDAIDEACSEINNSEDQKW